MFKSRRVARTYVGVILGFHSREEVEIKTEKFKYRKSRVWEMKEDKYTKSVVKNKVYCNSSYTRYSEKRLTQIYKALYGDAMLVSLSRAQIWPPETKSETSVFLSFSTYA